MISRSFALPFALLLAVAPVSAQKPSPTGETLRIDPEAKAAIDRIRSPFCPGMMLEVCTSAGGAMLRDSIQRMAEAGMSADSIVERVIAEYGEEWRAEPRASGAGLWAWVLPPAALAAGLLAVGVLLLRRRRRAPKETSPPTPVEEADEERLRAALKQMDREEEPVF